MIGDKYIKQVRDKEDDIWIIGSRKFFDNNGAKCTNPDHETLIANGYAFVEPEPVEEYIPPPLTIEQKWRNYMDSISWNRDLTWGAPK